MLRIVSRAIRGILSWIGKIVVRTKYRLHVVGHTSIPKHGPAVVVFNHVSYADPVIRVAALQRPIRFLMWKGHYGTWILRTLGDIFESFPVSDNLSTGEMVRVMKQVKAALRSGDLVGISAEGMVSELGFMLPFRRGIETIMRFSPEVPVIPAYIDGMWGSIFTYHRRKFFWRTPRELRRNVAIVFGNPVSSPKTARALRKAIQLLGVEASCLRRERGMNLGRAFAHQAARSPHSPCLILGNGRVWTYRQMLVGALRLCDQISQTKPRPTSLAIMTDDVEIAIVTYLAAAICGIEVATPAGSGSERCYPDQSRSSTYHPRSMRIEEHRMLIDDTLDLKPNRGLTARLAEKLTLPVSSRWRVSRRLSPSRITSGSMNDSRWQCATLRSDDLLSNAQALCETLDLSIEDQVIFEVGPHHPLSQIMIWACFLSGASVFLGSEEDNCLRLTIEKSTLMPKEETERPRTVIRVITGKDDSTLDRELRSVQPGEMLAWWEAKVGCVVTTNRPNVPGQVGHREGTVGHPLPGTALRIVDPGTGIELEDGEIGIVEFQNAWTRSRKLEAGSQWYRTGRSGCLDPHGFLRLQALS